MLSAIIALATLFIQRTSSCASIIENGVPTLPLHVCSSFRRSGMTFYFQLVCDETGYGVYMSAHMSATCSDTEFAEIPFPLEGGMTVNCERVYDCSYAKYRLYNDSANTCTHTTSTPYFELPMVVDECAYDTSVGGSKFYSCDDSGIYSNLQIGDTDAVCEDTQETPFIEEGCTGTVSPSIDPTLAPTFVPESTGQFVEISECVSNEKPDSVSESDSDDTFFTQDMIIIIAVVCGVFLLTIVGAILCYKRRANGTNKETKYDQIPTPNNNSSRVGHSGYNQQVQIQTRQNNVQQIQYVQHNTTDIPLPPPIYDNGKGAMIGQWLTQNAQIPATDANNYAQIFVDNGFDDLSAFKEITSHDLVEIGIAKLGHRKVIMKAIQSIQ